MRAVILAAGRGRRMGPFTDDRPKCLIELAGGTLLDRQVAALRTAGATRLAVVAGWRAELFDGRGLHVFRNERWADTTMVASLAAADPWLSAEPTLVSYGDIVYGAATARRLAEAPGDLAIAYDPAWRALWERRFAEPLADAETFRITGSGRLTEIGGRPESAEQVQGQYMGLLRFTPRSWAVVSDLLRTEPAVRGLDLTGLLRFLVQERDLPVDTVAAVDPWCEFDHPDDLTVGLDVLAALAGDGGGR